MELTRIGTERDPPARVTHGWRSYLLVRDGDGYALLSTVCPHMGSEVEDRGTHLECPNHGWCFDRATGASLNATGQQLGRTEVVVRDGELWAALPELHAASTRRSAVLTGQAELTVHAHACLEIARDGFSLLVDPWLRGPAMMGGLAHFPPPLAASLDLVPDALFLSHEHSDHFHEPTLVAYPRDLPVYVPDFPNRRMVQRLDALGFTDVTAMPFGVPSEPAPGLRLTCFEPASLWNDAIVLLEVDGLRILNLNDAGLNHRIAAALGPVDLVTCAFTEGASSYPLMWQHLDAGQKAAILERNRQGKLDMLKTAARMYGAERLLPIAGHFTLWHPMHHDHIRAIPHNSLGAIKAAFADEEAEVVDLLPGERLNLVTGRVTRRWSRGESDELHHADRMLAYARQRWDPAVFAAAHPPDVELDRDEVGRYFTRLNDVPDIAFCEDLTVRVRVTDLEFRHRYFEVCMALEGGRLRLVDALPGGASVEMEVPRSVMGAFVRDGASWDESQGGYWCRFTRDPDVYHTNFWRLLQAPYYRRRAEPPRAATETGGDTVIAELIERHGPAADRLLRRYGLFCAGCQHSTAETIGLGARAHGVASNRVDRLVEELRGLDR